MFVIAFPHTVVSLPICLQTTTTTHFTALTCFHCIVHVAPTHITVAHTHPPTHTHTCLQIASRLRKTARDLGDASIDLVHSGASVQGNPDDQASRRELADNAKVVSEKVSLQYLSWLLYVE